MIDPLVLMAGGRFDHFVFKTDPDAAAVPEGLTEDDIRLDQSTQAVTGSFGVIGRVTDSVNLVANVANAFRAPNAADTVRTGEFTFGYGVPSPGVGPERSITVEAGPRVDHRYVAASASFFYTSLTDIVDSEPGTFNGRDFVDLNENGVRDDGEDVFVKRNIGEAHIQGFEAAVSLRPSPQWVPFGSFTWMGGRNDTEDAPLDRAFPTNGTVGLRWQDSYEQDFWAEIALRLVAEFPASEIPEDRRTRDAAFRRNPQDSDSGLLGGDGTVPGYRLLSLRAGARITDWADARLSVTNLLNAEYRDKDSRIDGEGLNVLGTLVLRY